MIHQIQPHALVVFKTGANGNEDFITGEREMGSLAPVFKSVGLPKRYRTLPIFLGRAIMKSRLS